MNTIKLTADELNMIQTLRRQKAQQGAEDTHSNEGDNNNIKTNGSKSNSDKPKRVYKVDPNFSAARASMVKFRALPLNLQTTENKWACVLSVLGARHLDIGRFSVWVLDNAQLLLHTYDFETVCKNYQREPQAVAENLVLEGKKVCNDIRLNGLASYNGNIRLFEKRLIPDQYRFNKPAEGYKENNSSDVESEAEEGANA